MNRVFRVLSALVGLILLASALRWLFTPETAAQMIGMPLLTDTAASSQIGDIGAFFLTGATLVALAQRRGQSHWLYPPALLVGSAALLRTLAALLGHANFAFRFVAIEVILAAILLTSARLRAGESVSKGAASE